MNLEQLMALPWTWQGPRRVEADNEVPFYELRVAELPDFFVAAATSEAARMEASPALRAFLRSYLDVGETPPLPKRRRHWIWAPERSVVLTGVEAPQAREPVAQTRVLEEFQAA